MRRIAALSLATLALLGGCGRGDDAPDVVAYFADVGDLVENATVQINDVEIGTVRDIELQLNDGRMVARVSMDLDADVTLDASRATAVIRQTSLLGEQFVALDGVTPFAATRFREPIEIPLERTDRRVDVETFLTDLSGFVGEGGLEDLNRFTEAQAIILDGRADDLAAVIDELEQFTGTIASHKEDLGRAITSLGRASRTLARNRKTLDRFFDSLQKANRLLAANGDEIGTLLRAASRFGVVQSSFLREHSASINEQLDDLRPVLEGVAGASTELGIGIEQLNTFFKLFPKSLGTGRGGNGAGDYIQVDAVLCEELYLCSTRGEKGDVPGEGT